VSLGLAKAVGHYDRGDALTSLGQTDPEYPVGDIHRVLAAPENDHLLGYVHAEAFTHVFPGDQRNYPRARFFADLDRELSASPRFHLWTLVPLCRYRCHFCQFPILVLGRDDQRAAETTRRWVDANIAEARLWLEAVPALRTTPIGEFCLFGGTPTAIEPAELDRLASFYLENFAFDADSSLRVEGSPDSIDAENLAVLRKLGFHTLTYGIQTFDDELLTLANRRHTGAQALEARQIASRSGFDRVDADLVWGLPGQTIEGFVDDVRTMIAAEFSTIVAIKLHLRSFHDVDSAIGHVSSAPWEDPRVRERIERSGYRWPSLGRQFQMRDAATGVLAAAGYHEHPTTYFPRDGMGPELWRALNLDQDKQYPQIGIGLGGYTWSQRSEASNDPSPRSYLEAIESGQIPLTEVTGLSDAARESRAVRMAFSTCQPLSEEVHVERFPGSSLFGDRWLAVFAGLAERGLLDVNRQEGQVRLTAVGMSLVEAIMATEIR
jgi:oxygen-independent coproporphyrinogen-3 oxidase